MPNALSDLDVTLHDRHNGRRYNEIRRYVLSYVIICIVMCIESGF